MPKKTFTTDTTAAAELFNAHTPAPAADQAQAAPMTTPATTPTRKANVSAPLFTWKARPDGERRDRRAVALPAARLGACKERQTRFVDPAIIHMAGIAAGTSGGLLRGEQAVLHQKIRIDEIGVARIGRKALVGRIAVACRAEWKKLPEVLSRRVEKVGKVVGRFSERADAVGRGK